MEIARQRCPSGRGSDDRPAVHPLRQAAMAATRPCRSALCDLAPVSRTWRRGMNVRTPRSARAAAVEAGADALWYKDAIIYQLHVKSFFDSNNDGIGDFPGLISKLDYIADLGVNTIWLLPFYPSPRFDDGYDI